MNDDYLNKLIALFGIPQNPVHVTQDSDWVNLENQLNIIFPSDYKKFFEIYGAGHLRGVVRFYIPSETGTKKYDIEYLKTFHYRLNETFERIWKGKVKLYPDKDGWIVFGGGEDRLRFFWKPKKKGLNIVMTNLDDVEEYSISFSELVYKMATETLESKIFKRHISLNRMTKVYYTQKYVG